MRVEYLIIGGGIAGAAMAYALREREVLLVDAAENVAAGASGNAKGIIRPFLSFGNSEMRKLYHAAYQECLKVFGEVPDDFILQKGLLQLPGVDETRFQDAPKLAGLGREDLEYFSPQQISDRLQMECRSEGIFWPRAVIVNPVGWVKALLGATPTKTSTHIIKLSPHADSWRCETDAGDVIDARYVILATGNMLALLPAEIANQIRPRTGQISMVPAQTLPIIPHAISFGHYWIPAGGAADQHIIGATFEVSDTASVTAEGHQRNIAALQELTNVLPEIQNAAQKITPEICTGRAAVRATTMHHMPICGRAAQNLFYITGLGSRGLMSAPYIAKQLCKMITGSAGNKD